MQKNKKKVDVKCRNATMVIFGKAINKLLKILPILLLKLIKRNFKKVYIAK